MVNLRSATNATLYESFSELANAQPLERQDTLNAILAHLPNQRRAHLNDQKIIELAKQLLNSEQSEEHKSGIFRGMRIFAQHHKLESLDSRLGDLQPPVDQSEIFKNMIDHVMTFLPAMADRSHLRQVATWAVNHTKIEAQYVNDHQMGLDEVIGVNGEHFDRYVNWLGAEGRNSLQYFDLTGMTPAAQAVILPRLPTYFANIHTLKLKGADFDGLPPAIEASVKIISLADNPTITTLTLPQATEVRLTNCMNLEDMHIPLARWVYVMMCPFYRFVRAPSADGVEVRHSLFTEAVEADTAKIVAVGDCECFQTIRARADAAIVLCKNLTALQSVDTAADARVLFMSCNIAHPVRLTAGVNHQSTGANPVEATYLDANAQA